MKVLSIVQSMNLDQGGPPEVLRNQIYQINKSEKIIEIFELNKIKLISLILTFLFRGKNNELINFIKKFDIFHFHEIWSLKIVFFCYFANKFGIKYFFVGHGYLDPWSVTEKYIKKKFFISFFLQRAFKAAYATFFSTKEEYLDSLNNVKSHKVFIIPNGINLNFYEKKKIINKTKKKIVFFGRIHKKKGIELLLDAIKNLPSDYFDNFTFEITGPGHKDYVKKISRIITNFDPTGNKVVLKNPVDRDKKIEYLYSSDVFILPSYEEGDSIALKEALACSLPVIISRQCRMNIVKEYNAGLVIETDVKSITSTLTKIKSLDIIKMGENARKLIEQKYDNTYCSSRLLKIYEDVYTGSYESQDWI